MKNQVTTDILPTKTAKVFKKLSDKGDEWNEFYLSGGTGLALQLKHRQSEDLDFFSAKSFEPQTYLNRLQSLGEVSQIELNQSTLNLYLDGVKLQFLNYPYKLLKPLVKINNLWVSDVLDIALTKLITISQRGSKKDFVDLYFILKTISLKKLFDYLPKKYLQVEFNRLHIIKALTYFDEADKQPDLRMIQNCTWMKVKTKIIREVSKIQI